MTDVVSRNAIKLFEQFVWKWNLFDLIIVILSLPWITFAGSLVYLLRLIRLTRAHLKRLKRIQRIKRNSVRFV